MTPACSAAAGGPGVVRPFRVLATEYIDAQLTTMASFGSPANITAAKREQLIDHAERLAIDAQPSPVRRRLLRAIRRSRS